MRGGSVRQRWGLATIATVLLLATTAARLEAQSYPESGSLELGGSVFWIAGSDAGVATAEETENQTGSRSPFTLFETSARLRSAFGVG